MPNRNRARFPHPNLIQPRAFMTFEQPRRLLLGPENTGVIECATSCWTF